MLLALIPVLALLGLLGAGFMAVRSSRHPWVQMHGPWIIGAIVCLVATLLVSTIDSDLSQLVRSASRQQIKEVLLTTAVMAALAGEAVLISFWAMRTQVNKLNYLLVFSCTTFVVWFITFLVMSTTIPGS
jgi:hypothetical protein